MWSHRKSVILQPKPKTSNENVIYSIYNMVVVSLKIETVVSNEAMWICRNKNINLSLSFLRQAFFYNNKV